MTEQKPMCSVCTGTGKPVSGLPCICGGIGTQEAELDGFRRYSYELEQKIKDFKADEEVEKIEAIEREYYIKGYDAGKAIQWQHFIEQACEGGWTNKGMPPKDVPVLMVRTGSEQIPKWKWKPLDCSFKQAIRDRFEGEKC